LSRRVEEIKEKGFDLQIGSHGASEEYVNPAMPIPVDYAKITVGVKKLDNPVANINYYKKINPKATKENVMKALHQGNVEELRLLSDFFYKNSGVYARLCRYMAFLYNYDYMVTPIIIDTNIKTAKVLEGFYKSLVYLDSFNAKKTFGDIALKVVRHGAYYGYKMEFNGVMTFQELPAQWCRSRFFAMGKPVLEFNMRYFDQSFPDTVMRMKMLKLFPAEFTKGYILYKEGKLVPDFASDQQGWYMLDVNNTVKFSLANDDIPMLASILPSLIDLEEAKEIDRKKMLQQLLKIIVQQMPLDKNGELIFDVDEARALHNNAVSMLKDAIGIDVLTTFAEVKVEDLADRTMTSAVDEITKVERAVFNEAGVSQQQFNTAGNLALEKSVANDEASMRVLVQQFEFFLNELLAPFNKNPKKLSYKVQMLSTTIYNYKELAKLYGDQMKVGFSKILPQIALGQSQSSILANAYFENEILDLNSLFTPPAMSSTTAGGTKDSGGDPGRPALPDDQKSEKTIQNKESMG